MKKYLLACFLIAAIKTVAQDEGEVTKRERIQRDKSIFIGGGISSVLGSNFGDYSTGVNFEAGFLKRLNRVFAIGGSFSYLGFKYDPSVQNKAPITGDFASNFYYDDVNGDGYALTLNGGDLQLTSIALNLKFNFIPVKDDSKISFYGFAKPFFAYAQRSEVSGLGEYWYLDASNTWTRDATGDIPWTKDGIPGDPNSTPYPVLAKQAKFTGGIFFGPGIELNPGKKLSVFLQASFGYTFPINIVSTRSYGHDIASYNDPNFPMKDLGFTSVNFSGGVSLNLD